MEDLISKQYWSDGSRMTVSLVISSFVLILISYLVHKLSRKGESTAKSPVFVRGADTRVNSVLSEKHIEEIDGGNLLEETIMPQVASSSSASATTKPITRTPDIKRRLRNHRDVQKPPEKPVAKEGQIKRRLRNHVSSEESGHDGQMFRVQEQRPSSQSCEDHKSVTPDAKKKVGPAISYHEPISKFMVTELAGIGETLGKRLEARGFDKAEVVLGQFLVLKKNKELFEHWLKDIAGLNKRQAADCYMCLFEWCHEFL